MISTGSTTCDSPAQASLIAGRHSWSSSEAVDMDGDLGSFVLLLASAKYIISGILVEMRSMDRELGCCALVILYVQQHHYA
jgi:hypothetical protein